MVLLIFVYVRSCFHLNFYYNTIQYPHTYYVSTVSLCFYLLLCCTILQILPENTEVDVEEEEIEELTVKSPSMLIQERQDHAEESGQVITLLDTPNKTTAVVGEENTEDVVVPIQMNVRKNPIARGPW